MLVHRADRELGLLRVHLGGHALGELEDHRVREAEREVDVLPLHLGLEADAADLEAALVALHDALDGILDQRAGEAVEPLRDVGLVEAVDLHLTLVDGDLHVGVGGEGHLPLRPLDLHDIADHGDLHLLRDLDGLPADTGHGIFPYQTVQISSPPTFCLRASRSTITPFDVEMIAMPIPLRTRGMESVGT